MLARALAFCIVLIAFSAAADTARVIGGEHADFTRLVVEASAGRDWRLGRSADGYELDLGPDVTGFDVTEAFRKIPRDRITALWRDPDNGRLRFSLACACHAIAFEFRPGTVVIDIRSGPPPAASGFEEPLDQSPGSGVTQTAEGGMVPTGYDWLAVARDRVAYVPSLPIPAEASALDPLRDALLAQISRGVAEGTVEIAEDGPLPAAASEKVADGPWSRISIGEMPGVKAGSDRAPAGTLTASGASCIPDSDLDIAAWGLGGPVSAQIGLARSGLLSEFDAPMPDAIFRAARLHIHLGFGAEARQYLQLLRGDRPQEAALLTALAHIVDEEPLTGPPFEGQESCDTAAALWSVLAGRGKPLPAFSNGPAVARSFSSLPLHLRRYLGPPLVDAFLASGDDTTARQIRDAVLRVPSDGMAGVELMKARYHLASGEEARAGAVAGAVLQEGGQAGAEALVTLVEAAFRGNRQLDPKVPLALDAFLREAKGTAAEPPLLRARILAAAVLSDYPTAFALLDRAPSTFADLWSLAATGAADDLFLTEAAAQADQQSRVAPAIADAIARRLVSLGFPDLALRWLGPVKVSSSEDLRLLAARALLALRDAPAALVLLEGINASEAAHLRASALQQLGDSHAAAQALIAAGASAEGERALTWTQDWALIGSEGPQAWQDAAALLDPAGGAPAAGPITRGREMAEESTAARAVIEGLLINVGSPPPRP